MRFVIKYEGDNFMRTKIVQIEQCGDGGRLEKYYYIANIYFMPFPRKSLGIR